MKFNPASSEPEKDISDEDHQLVRLAALLHDVGNLPFGHTLEDETCVVTEQQEDKARLERFLAKDKEIGKLLINEIGQEGLETLTTILSTKSAGAQALGGRAYICDIVKNTVCADLLDYLERDAYHCNLNISIGDRFMKYLFVGRVDPCKRLAIRLWKETDDRPRPDILSELTFLLEARYHIAERVYFHHARIASSAMIGRAVWSALKIEGDRRLTLDMLCRMGDDELLRWLGECSAPVASKLGTMLDRRQLFKRVANVEREVVEADKKHDRLTEMDKTFCKSPPDRVRIEDEIAELCGLEAGDVLIYCPDPEMNLKAADMLVTWRNGIRQLRDIDDPLLQSRTGGIIQSHKNLWQCRVFINPNKRGDGEILKRVRQVSKCHLRGDGSYDRDTIVPILLELAETEGITLPISRAREVGERVLAPERSRTPLTRSFLLAELRGPSGQG